MKNNWVDISSYEEGAVLCFWGGDSSVCDTSFGVAIRIDGEWQSVDDASVKYGAPTHFCELEAPEGFDYD